MLMDYYVIVVTDFKSEVRPDLRGCLEAAVALGLLKGLITYKQYAHGLVRNWGHRFEI